MGCPFLRKGCLSSYVSLAKISLICNSIIKKLTPKKGTFPSGKAIFKE